MWNWTREEFEKLSTQRLYNLYQRYRLPSYQEKYEQVELMKDILDTREHIPRKQKKKPQGKQKRGTKNTEVNET